MPNQRLIMSKSQPIIDHIRILRLIKAMTVIGNEINSIAGRTQLTIDPPERLKVRIKALIDRVSVHHQYEPQSSVPEAYRSLEYLQKHYAVLRDNPNVDLSFNQAKLSIVINTATSRIIDAALKVDDDLELIMSIEANQVIDEIIRFVRLRWPQCKNL